VNVRPSGSENKFLLGVIEGFYGHQWSWSTRADYAAFLSDIGFDCYIYAPKGDPFLRSRWREQHSWEQWSNLSNLVEIYHKASLRIGVGLSPLGLNKDYSFHDKINLLNKVRALNDLNIDILCILFDDTEGDIPDLAQRQSSIVNDILSVSSANQFVVCPTYYSCDPVLEEVFGKKPAQYLENLALGIPSSVDIFWTGDKVISTEYTGRGMTEITNVIGRRPVIWDNYPVNDGKVTSNFLNLRPHAGRPRELRSWSSGHMVNPMNQPLLSTIALHSLADSYHSETHYDKSTLLLRALGRFNNTPFSSRLVEDVNRFQDYGLGALTAIEKTSLISIYQQFDHPAADEVCEWLAGHFQFDPECLTS
jgi:hyaluronoglucosaminidase